MIKEIKQKLTDGYNWIKRKITKTLITLGIIGVASAATIGGVAMDAKINPYAMNGQRFETYLAIDSKVEIGGDDINNFKPEVKLGKWGNETWLKVKYPTTKKIRANRKFLTNKVEWKDTKKEVHFYPLKAKEQMEDGGFEIEVLLKEKPISNKVVLNIETQSLDFFYQPALTQKEIDEGAFRPENVIGSYAVYHSTKQGHIIGQTNYKAGKAFHIYRPKIIDKNGDWIWGEMNINKKKGTLTITIDQNWLNNAIYPVNVDPTFGYTTAGSGSFGNATNARGSVFTLSEDGTVSKMTVNGDGGNGGGQETAAIMAGDGSSLVATTDEITGVTSATIWRDLSFSSPPDLSAGDFVFLDNTVDTHVYTFRIRIKTH